MYGLPDAPRAWWEELHGFMEEIGFQSSRMDPAFMIHYLPDGSIGAMAIIHVDDLMIAGDGSKAMEALIERLHSKYPFGEWVNVYEVKKATCTGQTIELDGEEFC